MKQAGVVLGLIVCCAFLSVADGRAGPTPCAKVYLVRAASVPEPRIDGVFEEREWPAESWDSGMSFPWRDEAAPATAFSFQADDQALYFAFRVVDDNVVPGLDTRPRRSRAQGPPAVKLPKLRPDPGVPLCVRVVQVSSRVGMAPPGPGTCPYHPSAWRRHSQGFRRRRLNSRQ